MTQTDPDFSVWTDDDLTRMATEIAIELNRRRLLAQIPEQIAALNREFLSAEGSEQGEPWKQPVGAHDAYPKDWVVTHEGQTWVSTIDANVWEPGVSGWKPLVVEGDLPIWVAPSGSHDAYAKDAEVFYEGRRWKSLVDGNVWTPGAPGSESLWADLGPWPEDDA